ncbi:MAG TPA: hypothetical protein VMT70_15120 [Vicinamibacteria bacterium]|nr:hypothetical protein [Vicinamibacteria bacterium]
MLRIAHAVLSRRAEGLLSGALALALTVQCGGGSTPTTPPTPVPTPTPTPVPTPTPPGALCSPTPPPLYGINVHVHDPGDGFRRILDSRPQVINMNGYCDAVGQGSPKFCWTRVEGDPQASACDQLAVGKALDTGRWGPTWYWNDLPCTAQGDTTPGCKNDQNNQFLLVAKGPGTYEACAAADIPVAPGGSQCGSLTIN